MDINAGDIIMVTPNEFHRTSLMGDPYNERISIYLLPCFAEQMGVSQETLFGAFYGRKRGVGNVIPASIVKELGLNEILENMQLPRDDDEELLLRCKISELLLLLKKAVPLANESKATTNIRKTVKRALEYINSHLCENISTDSIAKALFIDKSYLCREFKRNIGVTVNEYISHKRIILAIQLIENGVPCTDACYQSGFGNYSSFYKYYKKYTENSPHERKYNISKNY
jgi:AraC-like DNA-binding protein